MKRYTLILLFIIGINLNSSHNTAGSDNILDPRFNKDHTPNRSVIDLESSSNFALKWLKKDYDDSSETSKFGWAGGNYGIVITNKKIYVYNRGDTIWKNLNYCLPGEKFKSGNAGEYCCLFWTDKNIYIFSDWQNSFIIKAYIDSAEYPIQGYVNDDQAMVLTNKRIYICLPDLKLWTEHLYELTEDSSVGGALSSENALIWTDHGIYFSYWFGSILNVTNYVESSEIPKYGGISTDLAYVATNKNIYAFLCYGPLEPFTSAYVDSNEVPRGGGVSNIFVVVWTDKRIYVFRTDIGLEWKVISDMESSETVKRGGVNESFAYVRTNKRRYILPHFASDWKIQEYGAKEIYSGGYMTYNSALAWTDKNIYLYHDVNPNFIIIPFGDGEIPEKREENSWLCNTVSVQTNKNIHVYNSFNDSLIIQNYVNYEEGPKGADNRNVLSLAVTDRAGYIYDALAKKWSIQEFNCNEYVVYKILGDLSALIVTDQGSYSYFQDQGWTNQPFIDYSELPQGGAVSYLLVLSWTDKRIYLCDTAVESTRISQPNVTLLEEYALYQNYPNPFNSSTIIRFDTKDQCHVVLKVFNLIGQEIITLLNEKIEAGHHKVRFDGSQLPSGVYFLSVQIGRFKDWKKMLLLR